MSYNYIIQKDNPRHFFPLGTGATAYSDATGKTGAKDVIGVPEQNPPLVVGGGNSLAFNQTNHFRFETSILQNVSQPFTLEAWFKPLNVNAPVTIIGQQGVATGLYFDGEKIIFATRHGAAGSSVAQYYPEYINKGLHVVGVHTATKNELYVNGVLVAAAGVTEQMQLFGYGTAVAPTYFYSGHGVGNTGTILADSLAVYAIALASKDVSLHFFYGRDARDFRSVVTSRGGSYWTLDDSTAFINRRDIYNLDLDWFQGLSASVIVRDNSVYPLLNDSGVTIAGSWENGFIFTDLFSTISGSKIEWDSDGSVVVESSIDNGTTWTACTNNRSIPGISQGFVTTNKTFLVRARFLAGETASIARLNKLTTVFYNTKSLTSPQSAALLLLDGTSVAATNINQPIEQDDFTGAYLTSLTTLSNPEAEVIRTLEMWVNTSVVAAVLTNLPANTRFVNGVSGAAIIANQWNHVVFVLTANHIGPVEIGNDTTPIQLGMLAKYATALTSTEISALYNAYLGAPSFTVLESQKINVADAITETVKVYSYDWSVIASG